MRAGALRHKVTIEHDVAEDPASGTDGQREPDWETYRENVPAQVMAVTAGEYFRGQQIAAGVTHLVETRFVAGVDSKMRLRFCSRVLEVDGVRDPEERRRRLVWQCHEVK